jgi:hypothetical protein
MGSGAKLYMRKGLLIYEEMRKFFPIYEEGVCHTCPCTLLISLYMRKIIFSFLSVYRRFIKSRDFPISPIHTLKPELHILYMLT